MKKIVVLVCLFMTSLIKAESYEEFMADMNEDYNSFVTQMDKDFAQALGREWKEFDSDIKPSYEDPKPVIIPAAPVTPIKQPDIGPKINIITVNPPKEEEVNIPKVPLVPKGYKKVTFDFFSRDINLIYNSKLIHPLQSFNNHNIANYWLTLASVEINNLLTQIRTYKTELNLSDWHVYLLLKKAGVLMNNDSRNAKLLSWFLLNKLGYDVKLGMANNEIYLMPSSYQMIYNTQYSSINQRNYYNFEFKGKIRTYPTRFNNPKTLNFDNATTPNLKKDMQYRTLSFSDAGKPYRIAIPYNENLISLYEKYPTLGWEYYFNQPIAPVTKFEVFKQLKGIISNMTEVQAVNFLLHLTQSGFTYKTDGEQFGRERYLFFEETLNYPYSDCEDRSIFFAKLVKELLGLKVVGLHYPIHLATAVLFNSNVKGESITYQNKRYIICDPTYVGANIGKAQPQFKGFKDIEIIPIKD